MSYRKVFPLKVVQNLAIVSMGAKSTSVFFSLLLLFTHIWLQLAKAHIKEKYILQERTIGSLLYEGKKNYIT